MFFNFVFNCIVSGDVSLMGISLDTVGVVCSTDEGLGVLFQTESHRNIMSRIGDCLRGADEDLKYVVAWEGRGEGVREGNLRRRE